MHSAIAILPFLVVAFYTEAIPLTEDQQYQLLAFINNERTLLNSTMNAYMCYASDMEGATQIKAENCPLDQVDDTFASDFHVYYTGSDPIETMINFILSKKPTSELTMDSCAAPDECYIYKTIINFHTTGFACVLHNCEGSDITLCSFNSKPVAGTRAFKPGDACSECGVFRPGAECEQGVNLCPNEYCAPAYITTTTTTTTTSTTSADLTMEKSPAEDDQQDSLNVIMSTSGADRYSSTKTLAYLGYIIITYFVVILS